MQTRDAQLLVLTALADGPLHGYALNNAIERLADARLGAGSLYGALARLEAKGLIERVDGTGRRRPMRLTPAGLADLDRRRTDARRVLEPDIPDRAHYLHRAAAAGRAYKDLVLEHLALAPGLTVADLGCGPGADLPAMAATGAEVIGVDHDPAMLAAAGGTTVLADLAALPFPGSSIDRARTDRVLQHVASPRDALAEAHRVLRPGGRLVMAEPDWDSLAVDHPERELSRAYTRFVAERAIRNATVGRELARLAHGAGFEVAEALPVASAFRDIETADGVFGFHRVTARAVEAGYLTPAQAERWLDGLTTGPFLAALTMWIVVAERG